MNGSPTPNPTPLTQELLHYWLRHPEAQGTVEAIVEWWLLEHRIQQAIAQVRTALAELVEKDLVLRREQGDGRLYYAMNRDKTNEILALVGGSEQDGRPGSAGSPRAQCLRGGSD